MAEQKDEVDLGVRTIVVAIDSSDMSKHALQWTIQNILRDTDHLRLIHVQPLHDVADVIVSAPIAVPIYTAGKVRQESLDIARQFAQICEESSIENFKEDIILEDGSAGSAICEYIADLRPESTDNLMLVLGSRELGFLGRTFLGSVSEHCVRHCGCPVTVIKMPKSAEKNKDE